MFIFSMDFLILLNITIISSIWKDVPHSHIIGYCPTFEIYVLLFSFYPEFKKIYKNIGTVKALTSNYKLKL